MDLLQKLSHYRGHVFRWDKWKQLSPDWRHDHCQGCWATFLEAPDENDAHAYGEGWLTLWPVQPDREHPNFSPGFRFVPAPAPRQFQRDWICPKCFDSVRDELNFIVDPGHPQWTEAGI